MNKKFYLWCIPFALSIVCGVLNPCGGLVSIVAVVLSMGLLLFFQSHISSDIRALNRQYGTSAAVASELSVNNWLFTALTFTVINALLNLTLFWFCYTSIADTNTLPNIGFTLQLFGDNRWTVACIFYVFNVLFNILGMLMIFNDGAEIKHRYAAT